MYVCNSGFHKAISCFFDRSGHSYRVKGAWSIHYVTVPKSLGQSLGPALAVTTPYITALVGSCGTQWVGLWSFESSRSFVIDPATAGRGHFDMLAFPPATERSHTSPRGHASQEC